MDVIIGVDPHKSSHTAVALDPAGQVLGELRVTAGRKQIRELQAFAAAWPDRRWAVEGANGLGRLLAQQLVAAGEPVTDVPGTLSSRVRLLREVRPASPTATMPARPRSRRCTPTSSARSAFEHAGKEVCRLDVAACPDPVVAKTSKQAEVFYARMNNSTRSLAAEEVAAYISSRDR